MNDEPLITTIDEAKAALDEAIASAQETVDFYTRQSENARRDVREHEGKLYALKRIRRRMDPPVRLESVASVEAA